MHFDGLHPVPAADVEAVKGAVDPTVRGMIELQLLCGLRPGELCAMRPCDLETSGLAWTYRPPRNGRHVVYLGPVSREVLRPMLAGRGDAPPDEPLFMPADRYAEAVRQGCLRAGVPPFDPNRLRLNAAYAMAIRYGLDDAGAALPHDEPTTAYPQWQWTALMA